MTPSGVRHLNAGTGGARPAAGTGAHLNAYATDVGFSTRNRLVLRTCVPRLVHSTVLVPAATAPVLGPGRFGMRRPPER